MDPINQTQPQEPEVKIEAYSEEDMKPKRKRGRPATSRATMEAMLPEMTEDERKDVYKQVESMRVLRNYQKKQPSEYKLKIRSAAERILAALDAQASEKEKKASEPPAPKQKKERRYVKFE